ncbi:unnamed protein product [Protopolystoma xenopodis]|uniref:Uncharacterized protein n=1 Tax=Protopolystoma xenopodis TaxID=117903 RepID=A0A448WCR2_9PLAT|nr:unnamed protein product [Protopolystoma xenopodis]
MGGYIFCVFLLVNALAYAYFYIISVDFCTRGAHADSLSLVDFTPRYYPITATIADVGHSIFGSHTPPLHQSPGGQTSWLSRRRFHAGPRLHWRVSPSRRRPFTVTSTSPAPAALAVSSAIGLSVDSICHTSPDQRLEKVLDYGISCPMANVVCCNKSEGQIHLVQVSGKHSPGLASYSHNFAHSLSPDPVSSLSPSGLTGWLRRSLARFAAIAVAGSSRNEQQFGKSRKSALQSTCDYTGNQPKTPASGKVCSSGRFILCFTFLV